MSQNKFILIDGSSMLVTNYYGNLPKALLFEKDPEKKEKLFSQIMHNDAGQYTNAMYGMMRTILKIIDEQKPTHMMFAFDMTRDTFRREKYASNNIIGLVLHVVHDLEAHILKELFHVLKLLF